MEAGKVDVSADSEAGTCQAASMRLSKLPNTFLLLPFLKVSKGSSKMANTCPGGVKFGLVRKMSE